MLSKVISWIWENKENPRWNFVTDVGTKECPVLHIPADYVCEFDSCGPVCRQVKCQYMKSRLEINCWRVTMNIAQMGIFLSAMQVYWIRMHTNATDCRITIPAKRRPTTPYDIDSWFYEQWLKASYTIWSSCIICRWARFSDAIAT